MKVGTVFDRILDGLAFFAGVLLVFASFSVCAVIFSRYFLNRPLGWMIEINEYILLYLAFLLAAWVLKKDAHVKMDVVVERLNPKIQLVCNVAGSILGAIVFFVLTCFGIKVTWHLYQSGTLTPTYLELPKYPFTMVIPFGSFLFMLQFIRRAYGFIHAWGAPQSGNESHPGTRESVTTG
ncbi:MAG: TRAP transporter small permease [Deltaproteobacteria bacterium]|jgi:TRAP-type C4-dicarboxylate transport system permease small subunit